MNEMRRMAKMAKIEKFDDDSVRPSEGKTFANQQRKLNIEKQRAKEVGMKYTGVKEALEKLKDLDLSFGISSKKLAERWKNLDPVMQIYKDLHKTIKHVADNPDNLLLSQSVDWSQKYQTADYCARQMDLFFQKDLRETLLDYYRQGQDDYEEMVNSNISGDSEIARLKQNLEQFTKNSKLFSSKVDFSVGRTDLENLFTSLKGFAQDINKLHELYDDDPNVEISQRKEEAREFYKNDSNEVLGWYFTEKQEHEQRSKHYFDQLMLIEKDDLVKAKTASNGFIANAKAKVDELILNRQMDSKEYKEGNSVYRTGLDLRTSIYKIMNAQKTLSNEKIRKDILLENGVLEEKDAEQLFRKLLEDAQRFLSRSPIANLHKKLLTIKNSLYDTMTVNLTDVNNASSSSSSSSNSVTQ